MTLSFLPLLIISGAYASDLKLPQQLDAACATDVKETINTLHEAGFKGLIKSQDVIDPLLIHEIAFDMQQNRVINVDITFKDKEHKEPFKICVISEGITPDGDGPTFKSFILRQRITEFNENQDAQIEGLKKHLEDEHHPFQGDPSKINMKGDLK